MSNELKLSIENFQSISKGELIFHKGTTVIIGQSNSGKTATFRALKACLSNPSGSQRFIKNGAKSASVLLEYDGNQIIWKKTPKESSYIINGETFLKTGSSNAFKIMEDTGFVRDDNDTIMNIEEELQLPFPFGISKAELFKLFENVFCVSDSAIILKSAREQEDKVKDDISSLEDDLAKNTNKLNELQEFKKEFNLTKLESMRDKLKEEQETLLKLRDGLPIIERAILASKFDIEDVEFFETRDLIPKYKELKVLLKSIKKVKKLYQLEQTLPSELSSLNSLEIYEELKEINRILRLLNKLINFKIEEVAFENRVPRYEDLKEVKHTFSILDKLETFKLEESEFKNHIIKREELLSYLNELKNIQKKLKIRKGDLEVANKKVIDLEEKLKGFDVCPLCKRPFNK